MPEQTFDIYGIGNAVLDLLAYLSDDELAEIGLGGQKGQLTLVDQAQQDSRLALLGKKKLTRSSGGSVANSIVVCAQLGGRAAYCGLVGDDGNGTTYLDDLKRQQVTFVGVSSHGATTGTCVVGITPDAERTFSVHLGIAGFLAPSHLVDAPIRNSEWSYIEGYLLSSETAFDAAKMVATTAHAAGKKVALSLSDVFIVKTFQQRIEELLPYCSLLFANSSEALAFTGRKNEDDAFRALADRVPGIALTLGANGARLLFSGEECRQPGIPAKAIDTTGAGDAFAGGVLYGLVSGWDVQRSAHLGCLLGAKVVTQFGARFQEDLRAIATQVEAQ